MHRSLNDKELREGRIRQMATEMRLGPEVVRGLHDCSVDKDGLLQLLRQKGWKI